MALAEMITIDVGSAIAKSILKLWLKDWQLGADISSSLIDLLKSKTTDVLAQRRGERQCDAIGEKVGETLLPLFEIEGAHLPENARIAVAREVAKAFSTTKLSSALLAERNLEPEKLAKYVLEAHPMATRLFSADEEAFYQRIIKVACIYIVDIASQLPAFTERTFAEILRREDLLLKKTDEILQEIHHVREQLSFMVGSERFEIDYRLSVARKLDELQLFGADVSSVSRRHRLSVAYITLTVNQFDHVLTRSFVNKALKIVKSSKEDIIPSIVAEVTETALANTKDTFDYLTGLTTTGSSIVTEMALANTKRLLIRGPVGSGKTTLLQWLAVKSATRSFEGPLSNWNNTLPFYIRLRQCIQFGLPRPEAFPGLVAPAIADTMPKGWAHSALASGHALVLIDGLDEVSASRRKEVREWLKELVELYPQARFIITSRPPAIEEGWMDHEGFNSTELQPMQLPDIFTFIDHWHNAVREELHNEDEKAELGPLADRLKNEVKRTRSLRNLATNPLLGAMLCALNRDRGQQMPKERIELYEACCSLLLERRDQARSVDLTDYPALQLNYRQKRRFLEDLAYWMIKNGWSEVPLQLVDERFSRKLTEMQGVSSNLSGSKVRQLFVDRSGIIREPVSDQIDFVHKTFQEFLAAQAASDEMDTGVLVKNAQDDQWREVIILACGLLPIPLREKLIKGLLTRGDRAKKYRHQLHLLAVSCLDTSLDIGQELKSEVEERLSKLIPPKDMTDASSLALAGELAVKYLTQNPTYTASSAALCIRSLALIGDEAALDTLEGYAEDTREEVVNALAVAWDRFDRTNYARLILSKVALKAGWLVLQTFPPSDGLEYLSHLKKLTIGNCSQLTDLSPLANLSQLTRLGLTPSDKIAKEVLEGWTKLKIDFAHHYV